MINIQKLLRAIMFNIVLFYLFFKTSSTFTRIVMIPFIICGIAALGKSICCIIKKETIAKKFSIVYIIGFLIYWFGFLCFWCYLNIKDRNYILVILSIPFWIAGIYIVRKYLLNKENKTIDDKKQ